mgnify:CR=1 FL=1
MRFLIAAGLILCCSPCLAEDLPERTDAIKSLTVEQAAELVANFEGESLLFRGLTSIEKDATQELAKFEGAWRQKNACIHEFFNRFRGFSST